MGRVAGGGRANAKLTPAPGRSPRVEDVRASLRSGTAFLAVQRRAGNRATERLFARGALTSTTGGPFVQRTKNDVVNYVYDNRDDDALAHFVPAGVAATKKRIETLVTRNSVASFVRGRAPARHRQAVLTRWNSKQKKGQNLPIPKEFLRTVTDMSVLSGDDFEGYDSDTDDKTDIAASMKKKTVETITIFRPSTEETLDDVPVLSFPAAVRLGRQITKHALSLTDYTRYLPFAVNIGGKYVEYNSPGTRDIYCYPLGAPKPKAGAKGAEEEEEEEEAEAKPTPKPTGRKRRRGGGEESEPKRPRLMERSGGMAEHSWKGIATLLGQEQGDVDPKTVNKRIVKAFKGGLPKEATPGEAVAIGAIGSDLFKGVAGGMHFVNQLEENRASDFNALFTGTRPLYPPALSEGGRALVTAQHKRLKAKRKPPGKTLVEAGPPTKAELGGGPEKMEEEEESESG